MATSTKLFTPLTLGGKRNPVQLQHRVVMAPLTRLRSGEEGIPPAFAATYYGQRATEGGLLISEGVCISTTARGYFGTPGLFRGNQLEAWKSVTQAVHAKGGKIFAQLWHTGRVGHPLNMPNGELPVSASAVSMDDVKSSAVTREGRKAYVTPRALEIDEIAGVVEDYRRAAVNAIEIAGFDGVELHSANGYLLEQFLCDGVNQRTDKYGGSLENRSRFLFEALDAILTSVDPSKVGVRLSPFSITFGCTDSDPASIYGYVVEKLNAYGLAYLHVVEPRGRHVANPQVPKIGATAHFRTIYNGVLLTASGYDHDSAVEVIETGVSDAVAFGRAFLATPDLVKRLRLGKPFNEPDPTTFYLGGEEGYTDYPFLEDVVLVQSRIVVRNLGPSAPQRNYLNVQGNEHKQQAAQELQIEKDKEIVFLRGQVAAYTSVSAQQLPPANNVDPFAKRGFAQAFSCFSDAAAIAIPSTSPSRHSFAGRTFTGTFTGFPSTAAASGSMPSGSWAAFSSSVTFQTNVAFGVGTFDPPGAPPPSHFAAPSCASFTALRLLNGGADAVSSPSVFGASAAPAAPFALPAPSRTPSVGSNAYGFQEGAFSIGVAPSQPPTARQILKARMRKQKTACEDSNRIARTRSETGSRVDRF